MKFGDLKLGIHTTSAAVSEIAHIYRFKYNDRIANYRNREAFLLICFIWPVN